MRLIPFLIMLAVGLVTGSLIYAAEPPVREPEPKQQSEKSAAPPAATSPTPATTPIDPAAPAEKKPDAAQAAGKTPADKSPSPQRFVPTEQVRADFDVSFPIDI
jgi:predicted lipid-binding transport protein (Tim44 family)